MILILIILVIIAFFVPEMWIAVIAYIVWIFLTRNKRRDREVLKRIEFLIKSPYDEIIIKDLFWESCCSFVHDWGGHGDNNYARNIYDHTSLFLELVISKRKYRFHFFHAEPLNEIWLTYQEIGSGNTGFKHL